MGVGYVLWPLLPVLVLGAWFGRVATPLERWLTHRFGVRSRAAAAATTVLALLFLLPVAGVFVAAGVAAVDVLHAVRASPSGRSALAALVTPTGSTAPAEEISSFVRSYGGQAWSVATALFRGVSGFVLRVLVLVLVIYTRLAHGQDVYRYFADRIPVPRQYLARMRDAFDETGRALLVGMGGTALVQGAVATLAFVILRIPNAPVLGALTVGCAFVPVIGTALVWVPVSIGLALSERWVAAVAMLAIGAGVIGMLDNFVRPFLTRRAALRLPTAVLALAMIGGLLALGFSGILLGPLLVRLGSEMLDILQDDVAAREKSPPACATE